MSRRKKPFAFFLWHRRIGLAALIFTLILAVTGIMLNHTEELKLDESTVQSSLILNWYGINPEGSPLNFNAGSHWVSQWNDQLFFNGRSLYTHKEKIQGIVKIDNMIAIALQNFVLLIDDKGEIIELLPTGLTSAVKNISSLHHKIILLDTQNNAYISDADFTLWHKTNERVNNWSGTEKLSADKIEILKQAFRGQGLTVERVILDLHSGRIFNARWGIYIMDASAIIMMLLALSGLWIWWSRKLKMRSKKHYQKHH